MLRSVQKRPPIEDESHSQADNRLFLESAEIWVSGSGVDTGSRRITVQIECSFVPLTGTACPQYGADNANIVYQQFEKGFMISYD